MEWSEFARHLGRELAGLERDTILIVRERDESRHYVQAMREPDRLYAEAVSNNFLDGPLLLTPADEEVMSEAGWRPPAEPGPDGTSTGPRNWWTELPAYATAADHGRLADVMVTALRDVQGVRRPSDLVYESFHRHGTGLIELLDFGIDTADPGRVSKRRRTSAEGPAWDDEPGPAAPASVPALAAPVPGFEPESQGSQGPLGSQGPRRAQGPQGPQAAQGPQGGQGPQVPRPPEPRSPEPPARPAPGAPAESPDELEARLTEAKGRGDHTTYFEMLLSADLVLPATGPAVEDPDAADFPTTSIAGGTYIVAFTSPQALVRSGHRPDLYRRTTFSQLAVGWPDPAWQLAVNPGLPSEVHLDTAAVNRLDATQRALARPSAPPPLPPQPPVPPSSPAVSAPSVPSLPSAPSMPAVPSAPSMPAVPSAPSAPSAPPRAPAPPPADRIPAFTPATPAIASGIPLRAPHGARLWHWDGTGDEAESAVPTAVFDAIGGAWTQVRAGAVPAPRRD